MRGFLLLISGLLMILLLHPSLAAPLRAQVGQSFSAGATVEAHDQGVPVYAFGYTYVYGVSPDYKSNLVLQEGNDQPARKIQPKKSWEIHSNYFGSTPAREPRTAANDDQPLLSVHLIDGDPLSCWSSRGQNQPAVNPEWIRIDLPEETSIKEVVLVGHPQGMGGGQKTASGGETVKVGQAFPRLLEVRLSRDAWHWDTVYKNDAYIPADIKGRNAISFEPKVAKQIWILGSDLPSTHYFGHCFSIAGVEVIGADGENRALVSRGAGVQVSSTDTGFAMDRYTQDMLWSTQYDLGFKWSRVGYDMSLFQWAYVEREKGKLHVDERAEAAVDEAAAHGVNIIMTLDKGNWLYASTPKWPDRTRDLMETYSSNPGRVTEYDPMLQGYLNYVRFMVRHFKGRVKIFEVWNEWGPYNHEEGKKYAELLKLAIPIIREEDPQTKIMPASPGWQVKDDFAWLRALGEEGLLSQVDVIGFHPFYDTPPGDPELRTFPTDFPRFKKIMEGYGFKGQYMASEWDYFTAYPASDLRGYVKKEAHAEMQKAIYTARVATMFAHLDIVSLWNETFQTMQTMRGLSLFRNTWPGEVICPTQPEPVYYMYRTLSTVLEDAQGAEAPVTFSSSQRPVESYGFTRPNGERLVAFWLSGVSKEAGGDALVANVTIKDAQGLNASIIDTLDGVEKPLVVERTSDAPVIRNIHVQDWPLILRLAK
jgi:hypothetical protein